MKIPSCLTSHRRHTVFTLTLAALLASQAAQADTFIWSGTTSTDFETGTNWVGGTAPNPAALSDAAMFTGAPTINQPALSMDRALGALVFGTATGGWTLGGGHALLLGDLLTVGATTGVGIDASAMTSGTTTISNDNIYLGSATPQTWLIGAGGSLEVTSNVQAYPGGAPSAIRVGDAVSVGTLSLGGTGDNNSLGLVVTNGVVELNKTSTGSVHALGGNTTINGGALKLAGTGGDQIYSGVSVAANGGAFDFNGRSESFNQLTGTAGGLVANSSGIASTLTTTGGGTYAGAVTGNLSILSGNGAAFSGSLANIGDITHNAAGTSGLTLSGTVNNTGTLVNVGTNTGALTISGAIGVNVTGIVQNSTTSMTVISGNNTAMTAPITVKAGTLQANIGSSNKTSAALGSGAITLGDSANTGVAVTLNFFNTDLGATSANAITTVGNGLATINLRDYNETLTGNVTLGSDLALTTTNNNNSTFQLNGAISGTGNLITQVGGTNSGSKINLKGSVNHVGTITNSGSNTAEAPTTISGAIGSNVTAVIQNAATSPLSLQGANSFTSGITIKAGKVNVRGQALGVDNAHNVGTITLGDVANTGAAATLNVDENGIGGSGSGSNAINVVGSGTRTLSVTSWNPTFSGAVTLNGTDLTLLSNNSAGSYLDITGGITGVGNLTLQVTGTHGNSAVRLTTNTVNNTGTITNNGSGTQTNLISAAIGTNVTGVIQNSATSALRLTGANTYPGDTTVSAGTLMLSNANPNNETSTVTIASSGATLQLDYSGTDTVAKLIVGGVTLPDGVYGNGEPGGFDIPQIVGSGTLTVSAVGAGNYASWATANGISGQPASGDFDHDGLSNLVEYALNLDPKVSSQPAGTFSGGTLTFTKGSDAIANGDVNFVIETSTTLGSWTPVVTQNAPDATTTISYTLPTGLPKVFVRLKVTQIP